MSKEQQKIELEIEINMRSTSEGNEVTETQRQITNRMIESLPEETKLMDALTAGTLFLANALSQCRPDEDIFQPAFETIGAVVSTIITGKFKVSEK